MIGLALVLQRNATFDELSGILLSVIIGATVLHELIGPLTSKLALQKAGELGQPSSEPDNRHLPHG